MRAPRWLDPDRAWLSPFKYGHAWHALLGFLGVAFAYICYFLIQNLGILGSVLGAVILGIAYEVKDAVEFASYHPSQIAEPDQGFGIVDIAYGTVGAIIFALLLLVLA